jgi:hypothetical protein
VNSLPDVRGARPDVAWSPDAPAPLHLAPPLSDNDGLAARARRRLISLFYELRWPLGVFAITRVVYMIVVLVDSLIQHWPVWEELANWDGAWYLVLTVWGYPSHAPNYALALQAHTTPQSTLGFFPLYPMLMWLVGNALSTTYLAAGVIISLISGAVATVLIGKLAERWWGFDAGRRAVLFFCVFPGSVVLSIVYTEGILLALVAGCLLALEDRRWLLAGVLAAFATAVGPPATAIIPACAIAALLEMRRQGWLNPAGWRALIAPALAPLGLVAFGAYLWVHTGSPFASYTAQHYGWKESSSPLALYRLAKQLAKQVFGHHTLAHPGVNLNLVVDMCGAVFLVLALWRLWKVRGSVSVPALVWTLGIAFLAVTSAQTPTNARMLFIAFPVVLVIGQWLAGYKRVFIGLILSSTVLMVAMSFVSFVGTGLRP